MADLLPELEHVIEATPEGYRFTTTSRSIEAIGGMTVFGVVVGTFIAVPSFVLMFLSPGCCIFVFVGVVLMGAAPLAGAAMRKTVTVDLTRDGIRENTTMGQQMTWKHVEGLALKGDLRKRTATLTAGSYEIQSWKALKADAESGWTVDRVRWFAQQVSELSGIALVDELPPTEAFREREVEKLAAQAERRAEKRAKLLERNREAFALEHDTALVPATTREVDGATAFVLDRGQNKRPGRQTSTTEDRPVCIDEERLTVGTRSERLEDFEAFYVIFENSEGGVDGLLYGELKKGPPWKIARREAIGAGLLLGVAQALRERTGL